MERLVIGMLAHVDAGKTTLSEGMLYRAGALRRLGRVDHRDAFLDTHAIERERGITIFAKQAVFTLGEKYLALLDTPGHVDFSAEAERTLQVLDYAVLVISGAEGVQAHARTLWRLLRRYRVPTLVFVNKMDLPTPGKPAILEALTGAFGDGFVDFTAEEPAIWDSAAMCSEPLMEAYLERGSLADREIAGAVSARRLFPVYFGSALKLHGIDGLLEGLERFTRMRPYGEDFGARVFKVSYDGGARLTWMKITGGSLRPKDLLTNRSAATAGESVWEEKADQLRIYAGAKFTAAPEALAGQVCAVTGLSRTFPGQGLGTEASEIKPLLRPVLSYELIFPRGADLHGAYASLKRLEEEDPALNLAWDPYRRRISAQLMGEVQREVLHRLIRERFGLEVGFGEGAVLYRETIAAPAIGVGHYEPLKHFAHVQLLLEPLPEGSGLLFGSAVSGDELGRSWQRLILAHLAEKQHLGVLTGSPITDMRITITGGRAHLKHTEGGDFRQATYRAVRMGLMCAQSVLLEPYYSFRLELPRECLGRAMADIRRMDGEFAPARAMEGRAALAGRAPVEGMRGYARELAAYTRGEGQLALAPGGYSPCRNPQKVIDALGYDPEADPDNTPDSVFCSHGAGFTVKWDRVADQLRSDSGEAQSREERRAARSSSASAEEELMAIYERTYGPVKDRAFLLNRRPDPPQNTESLLRGLDPAENYLLVDGYNMIFAWEELSALARESMAAARQALIRMLANYQAYRNCNLILVFDAYKVTGGRESVEKEGGVYIVYTREAEIADVYIERAVESLPKGNRAIRVASSDGLEQLIIMGRGALRMSARELREEVRQAGKELSAIMEELQRENKGTYSIWQKIHCGS